jgi:hemerythrin
MKHLICTFWVVTLTIGKMYCQSESFNQNIEKIADSLYTAKNFNTATKQYLKLAQISDFNTKKSSYLYNASCCLSLQSKKDSALIILKKAIKNGFSDKENLLKDDDLQNLHSEKEWKKIISSIKENKQKSNDDPKKVKFISSDIDNFWIAYKTASKDNANSKNDSFGFIRNKGYVI